MQEPLPADQEVEAQQLAALLSEATREDLLRLARTLVASRETSPFGDTEFEARDILLRAAARAYERFLAQKKNGYEGASVTCPHCRQAAAYHGDHARALVGLFGTLRYRRAYYYCRRCGRGCAPFDQRAGITPRQLTPALEQLATLAGTAGDSFGRAAGLLEEMAGVRLSEATVARTTEDAGTRLAQLLGEGATFGPAREWGWHADARGRSVAYLTVDSTGTRQQGPGGARAEGRMAYVAGVYNPPPLEWLRPPGPVPRLQARYLSGLYPLAALGPLLRRQALQVGMEGAELWVALTDGGGGLESFCRQNFNRPDLVLILDFYHAASYLGKLARALHPQQEGPARAQAEQWCRLLKEEGGAATLAVLRQWDWPARQPAALREQRAAVEEYFGNNLHRMEYPEYLAEGWHTGSGVVESACKTVVGQRLKGAGMRWGTDGAHALCHLRALYRSEKGQWEAFWRRQLHNRPTVQQLN